VSQWPANSEASVRRRSAFHGRARVSVSRGNFYASRAHRTRASAIRSQDRRRLGGRRAPAAKRFEGIVASRASTARLSRTPTFFES
jgi:hypothetical protein